MSGDKAAAADWPAAEVAVAKAYRALVESAREQGAKLGPDGAWRFVRLPDGLECWLVIKPRPALPGPPPTS